MALTKETVFLQEPDWSVTCPGLASSQFIQIHQDQPHITALTGQYGILHIYCRYLQATNYIDQSMLPFLYFLRMVGNVFTTFCLFQIQLDGIYENYKIGKNSPLLHL
jgi:hypothetical protein